MEKLFIALTLPDYGNRTVYLEVFNETPTFYETRKYPNIKVYSDHPDKKGLRDNRIRWAKQNVKAHKINVDTVKDTSCIYLAEDSK